MEIAEDELSKARSQENPKVTLLSSKPLWQQTFGTKPQSFNSQILRDKNKKPCVWFACLTMQRDLLLSHSATLLNSSFQTAASCPS